MSNKMRLVKFAQENKFFRICCQCAKIEPTMRQASKFRNNKGIAFAHKGAGIRQMLIEGKQLIKEVTANES